jgi:hypothetical protein
VYRTGSGMCPVMGFVVNNVECATRKLIKNIQVPYELNVSIIVTIVITCKMLCHYC